MMSSPLLIKAKGELLAGNLIGIPTETVYGLAGDGYCREAIEKIYVLKKRPKINPLILHYADAKDAFVDVIATPGALRLAEAFWPGPLTLVLARSAFCRVPLEASAYLPSLAIRVPKHPLLRELLHGYPAPLAAPSANMAGKLSPTQAHHVTSIFDIFVLDGGDCQYGLESTIIDCREELRLLRHGAIPLEDIEEALGQRLLVSMGEGDRGEVGLGELHAPGLLISHYAPSKPLRLNATDVLPHEALLAFGQPLSQASHYIQLSWTRNLEEAASHLFSALHTLDQSPYTHIAVMPVPQENLGAAINDRLLRAAWRG